MINTNRQVYTTMRLRRCCFNLKTKAPLLVLTTVVIIILWRNMCITSWFLNLMGGQRPHILCIYINGRLANAMFQHAFLLHYCKIKKLQVVHLGEEIALNSVFELNHESQIPAKIDNKWCYLLCQQDDRWDCSYDDQFEKVSVGSDIKPNGFFQSWRYWKGSENEVRKMFTFLPEIKHKAKLKLEELVGHGLGTTLVGMHIRRGDYVLNQHFVKFGYAVASEEYLYKAMDYMREKYGKVIFIVCSNDIAWSKHALSRVPESEKRFVEGNTPEIDMALLTLTDHTIMTVGTFGWWAGWLTNGTTIYYKYPYRPNTMFMTQFKDKDTSDHFYPGWIGMS